MNIELVKVSGKTKLIKLIKNDLSVQESLGLVNSTKKGPVIQANYLIDQHGQKMMGWKKYGSFTDLVQKLLKCEIHGTRQEFIDKVYTVAKYGSSAL